jgi:hypothetical protein
MKTTLILITFFLISSDTFSQIKSEIIYFLEDSLLQELKVFQTYSSSNSNDYQSNSTKLDRTFLIDRTKKWMLKKYYCCSNQVNHYVKKYSDDWKIVEEFYFKVFIDNKDTIHKTLSKYIYDDNGLLIIKNEFSFFNNDSLILSRPSRTTKYYYNKRSEIICRSNIILKDNNPNKIEQNKAIYEIDRKGRIKKMSYYRTELNSDEFKVTMDYIYKYVLFSKKVKEEDKRSTVSGKIETTISKYKRKKLIKKEIWSDNQMVRKINYSYKDNLLQKMELVFIYESYSKTSTSNYEFIRNQNGK